MAGRTVKVSGVPPWLVAFIVSVFVAVAVDGAPLRVGQFRVNAGRVDPGVPQLLLHLAVAKDESESILKRNGLWPTRRN